MKNNILVGVKILVRKTKNIEVLTNGEDQYVKYTKT